MKARYVEGVVVAPCPDCDGAITNFLPGGADKEFGTVIKDLRHTFEGQSFARILYRLHRCGGCGRGGIAVIHDNGRVVDGTLGEFYPFATDPARLPDHVPEGLIEEFREAELTAAVGANRGASALFRSVLERVFGQMGMRRGI